MNYRALLGLCFLGSCLAPKPPSSFLGWHLTLTAESLPAWPQTCLEVCRHYAWGALSLVLRRDPIENVPEWVSGHRLALAAALETLEPKLLILEAPLEDTAFYPGAEATFWHKALREWLLTELLPFVSTYPTISQIAWGRGFETLPDSFWIATLHAARLEAPSLRWGISAKDPKTIPAPPIWDFFGIDASDLKGPPASAWRALRQPLYLFYPPSDPYDADSLLLLIQSWAIPLEAAFLYTHHTLPSVCQKKS